MQPLPGTPAFRILFCYKCFSAFITVYLLSLISTNGASETPFLNGIWIANFGALAAAFRSIDALIDPAFQRLNPFAQSNLSDQDKREIAKETTA